MLRFLALLLLVLGVVLSPVRGAAASDEVLSPPTRRPQAHSACRGAAMTSVGDQNAVPDLDVAIADFV
jgi:hypothetical protein